MEHFSVKSGHAMRVGKLIKEDWPIYSGNYSKNFGIKQFYTTFKSFVTKVLEYKTVCMHCYMFLSDESLLTSLVTSLSTITIH